MTDAIIGFFSSLPGELYVFVISLFPIIELRGAIPVGAAIGLPFYVNYAMAVLGNMLPVPFILLFISKFLDLLERFKLTRPVVEWVRRKADKHSSRVISDNPKQLDGVAADEKAQELPKEDSVEQDNPEKTNESAQTTQRKMTPAIFAALTLFVAIPLPGTGAWTGSLISALFNLPKRYSLLAIFLGVLMSGTVMCLASYGVAGFLSFIL
ncbi:MAG: small multi-drug export protein [Clostridia bacterium]|nr:small multi-drug export protein [Clostridia bacterium]